METTSEDFGFHLATDAKGFRVFDPIDFDAQPQNINLFAIGNLSRTFACSNGTALIIGTLNDLNQYKTDAFISSQCNVTQLAYNADNTVLFLLVDSVVHLLNIMDALRQKAITLTNLNATASLIAPSPTESRKWAIVSDNKLVLFDGEAKQLDSDSTFATFSSDGAMVYSAHSDATIVTYTLSGELTASIAAPGPDMRLAHLTELRFSKLLASYSYDDDDEESNQSYIVDLTSNEDDKFTEVDVASPFGSVERANWYYCLSLAEWVSGSTYFFVTSGKATEIDTIGLSGDSIETIIPANDYEGAAFPINDDTGDDASPIGLAVDLSCGDEVVKEPCEGVDEAQQLPKVWVLTNEGTLLAWWVFHRAQIKQNELNLQRSLDTLQQKPKQNIQDIPSKVAPKQPAQLESKAPAFGGPGFGSTSFGANKTLPGPSSFGGAASGSNTTLFGSSSFGNLQSLSQHAFGSTSFGAVSFGKTNNSFGSTGFGSSGLGNSSLAKSSTSGSGFAAFANKPSSFASTSRTSSSPFASLGASKDSPFGNKKVPFGQSDVKVSPFASLSSTKDSIFGSSEDNKQGPPEGSKNTLFGNLENKRTPIDVKNTSSKPTSNTNAFIASKPGISKGAFSFGDFSKSINLEEPDELLDIIDSNDTEDATMLSSTSTLNQTIKEPPARTPIFDSLSSNTTPAGKALKGSTQTSDQTVNSESINKPNDFTAFLKHKHPMEESPFAKLSFDQPKSKPLSVDSNSLHATADEESGSNNDTDDSESYVDVDESEHYKNEAQDDAGELLGEEYVVVNSDDYDDLSSGDAPEPDDFDEKLSLHELDIQEQNTSDSNKPVFEIFAGLARPTTSSQNSYERQLKDIINNTHGNFTVFHSNKKLVEKYLKKQSKKLIPHDKELLDYHRLWRLEDVPELRSLVENRSKEIKPVIELLTEFEKDLSSLEKEINEDNTRKNMIDKALLQLKLHSQYLNEENAKYYPLDSKNEEMQIRIRDKLAHLESLRDQLVTKMAPLKARVNSKLTSVDRIQELLFHINAFLSKYEIETEDVLQKLSSMSLIGSNESTPYSDVPHTPSQFYQKWKLSELIEVKNKSVPEKNIPL